MSDPAPEPNATPVTTPATESPSSVTAPSSPKPAAPVPLPREYYSMRLEIDPVIARADEIAQFVQTELPLHPGLARVSHCVAQAARKSKRVARKLKRPIGMHRLPAAFLALALGAVAFWVYWHFFHTSRLIVAIPQRDATQIRTLANRRTQLQLRETVGSRESIDLLQQGKVDLAFIQGGVGIPDNFPRQPLDESEVVLLFLRGDLSKPSQLRRIMTSAADQGSHTLAQLFAKTWGIADQVQYVHDWRIYTDDLNYQIAPEIDGVFVVKDPRSDKLDGTVRRLAEAGFRLVSPDIGARQLRLEFLSDHEIRPGYLDPIDNLPDATVPTYAVLTYLVARPGLTSFQFSSALEMLHPSLELHDLTQPTLDTASEIAQGLEAMLSILVYIGLTFFALLGLDVFAYRRRFHELNSLVSLISMHQSSKDVIFGDDTQKAHHVTYLSVCSDLLGIISVITGYYTQENSSLMYNRLSDVIHERCDSLKINIQLKILHASIHLPEE